MRNLAFVLANPLFVCLHLLTPCPKFIPEGAKWIPPVMISLQIWNRNHSGKCKFITPRNDLVTENTEKIVTKGMKSLQRVPRKKKVKKNGVTLQKIQFRYKKCNFVTENSNSYTHIWKHYERNETKLSVMNLITVVIKKFITECVNSFQLKGPIFGWVLPKGPNKPTKTLRKRASDCVSTAQSFSVYHFA